MQLHESKHSSLSDSDVEIEEEANYGSPNSEQLLTVCLRNHRLPPTCICVDSTGEHAFTGSKDGSIIKWCLKERKILNKINSIREKEAKASKKLERERHVKHINCIAISSDNKFLATGGWDKHIRIWSPDTLTWLHTFTLHRGEVTALAFRQDQHTLYSGSADRSVMIWTLEDDDNRAFVEPLYGHESPITSIDTLRKERVLTSGGRDQSIRIWKIVEQAQTVFQSTHESVDIVRYIDDQTFVSGGEDGSIMIWTTMKRNPVHTITNAHGSTERSKVTSDPENPFAPKLAYWITSLAVYSFKQSESKKYRQSNKRQKLDPEVVSDEGEDEEVDDDGEIHTEADDNTSKCLALIASGSCDSQLRVWKLMKNDGKYAMDLSQTLACSGFINDIKFTNNGQKIVAACGQEHRYGRWWRLKGVKNRMEVFDISKLTE